MSLDADLTSYYNSEARGGHRAGLNEFRTNLRQGFASSLDADQHRKLVEIGAGPGLDLAEWNAAGFHAVGLDLAPANVEKMHQSGLQGVTGSLYHLPFRSDAFDVLWTMSTFVHVPNERFDTAIGEMVRVVRPGGLLGIGTWGGIDFEGHPEVGELRPYRFFSLVPHERWRSMLGRYGEVEAFDTYQPNPDEGWEYQFAVVRAPG